MKKQKKLVVTLLATALLAICSLTSCSVQETDGKAESVDINDKISSDENATGLVDSIVDTLTEKEEPEILTLESKHVTYSSSGEFEQSTETEYDTFGNAIRTKYVRDTSLNTALAVGEVRQQTLEEHEYISELEYDNKNNVIRCVQHDSNGETSVYEYEYDEIGNNTKWSAFDIEGTLKYEYVYEYDEFNNLISKKPYIENGCVNWEEWEYDSTGNMLKHIMYVDPNAYGISSTLSAIASEAQEYEYDSLGHLIKAIQYSEDMLNGEKQIFDWFEYEYDTEGKQIKEINYTSEGFMTGWSASEYDALGNKVKTTVYKSDDSMAYWVEFAYDEKGNMTKQTRYEADGSVSFSLQYRYEYDSMGNKTKYLAYNANGDVEQQEEWKYDESGNLNEYINYNGSGVILEQIEYINIIIE